MDLNGNQLLSATIGVFSYIRQRKAANGIPTNKEDAVLDHLQNANRIVERENITLSEQFIQEERRRNG